MMERQGDSKPFHLRYSAISSIQSFDPDDGDINYRKIETILRACLETGSMTLAIDEIDIVCNPNGITPTMRELLKRGRHDNVNLIWTTRRPQEVNKLLLSQSDDFYVYQMHHPDDVDYFRKFMVFERGEVERLQVGESFYWHVGGMNAKKMSANDG